MLSFAIQDYYFRQRKIRIGNVRRLLLSVMLALSCVLTSAVLPTAEAGPFAKPSEVFKAKAKPKWTTKYDGYFKKYSKRYFGPFFDWKWFKAQAIAESSLRNNAKSYVGAIGVMQIMPATYGDIKRMNPHFAEIDSVRWNIAAGIYYNRYLFRRWNGLPANERLKFAFASYNAGLGNILKARRREGGGAKSWQQIAQYAPKETQGYVSRILSVYKELKQL